MSMSTTVTTLYSRALADLVPQLGRASTSAGTSPANSSIVDTSWFTRSAVLASCRSRLPKLSSCTRSCTSGRLVGSRARNG